MTDSVIDTYEPELEGEAVTDKPKIKCEVYSRVCGYYRPTMAWNPGKRREFSDRRPFSLFNLKPPTTGAELDKEDNPIFVGS